MNPMLKRWIRYFLPIQCVACGEAQSEVLCSVCQAVVLETSEVAFSLDGIGRVAALFQYSGPVKALIHHIKFGPSREGASLLATMSNQKGSVLPLGDYDWVIPIPGSASRERVRGFCLSELIFRPMVVTAHGTMSPILTRLCETRPLFDLGVVERKIEVAGIFSVSPQFVSHGETVLLVDDIVTSGATAQSAAKPLRQAGASRVDLLTVAAA